MKALRVSVPVLAVALFAMAPHATARDKLLVQQDYETLSDEDQWKYSDAWCIGAIDIAMETPGYIPENLKYARSVQVGDFIDGEGGTDEELQANVAYTTDFYRDMLDGDIMTLDEMLKGCGSDLKAP